MNFDIEWNGDALCEELKKAASEVAIEAAEIVLDDCNPPEKTGRLKKSGHVEAWPPASHGTVGASVVFDAPHSHLVHELPTWYELRNGEEKWLEKASQRKSEEVLALFGAKMGSVLNDG